MADYEISDSPIYKEEIRKLENTDPANADTIFNPLFQQIIENVHAVKQSDDTKAKKDLSNVEAQKVLNKVIEVSGSGSGLNADTVDGKHAADLQNYNNLLNKPNLKAVATSGSYNDLENKPTIPTTLPANGGNADTLDNIHANGFLKAKIYFEGDFNEYHTMEQIVRFKRDLCSNTPPGMGEYGGMIVLGHIENTQQQIVIDGQRHHIYTRLYVAWSGSPWSEWQEIWHSGNDGSGSGLDADMVDGKHVTDIQSNLKAWIQAGFSNPNLLINGDFQVWQRGSTIQGNGYTVDMWKAVDNPAVTTLKTDNGMRRTGENTDFANIIQFMEIPSSSWGKKATFSVYLKKLKNGGVYQLRCGHGTDVNDVIVNQEISPTDQFAVYSITFTIPSESVFWVNIRNEGTFQYEMKWAKVEIGELATPFSSRPYGQELALCQRYFRRIRAIGGTQSVLGYAGTIRQGESVEYAVLPLQVGTMRLSNPIVTYSDDFLRLINSSTGLASKIIKIDVNGTIGNSINLRLYALDLVPLNMYSVFAWNGGGYMDISAEF